MGREGMPPELVRGLIGGVQKVIHKRLYRGEPQELPGWRSSCGIGSCSTPRPRARCGRRGDGRCGRCPSRSARPPPTPPERLLRALAAVVAEKGYPETTITDIIERAGTSYRAFYEHFENKEGRPSRPSTSARCRCWRRRCRPFGGPRTGSTPSEAPRRRCSSTASGARVRAAGGGRDVRGGQSGRSSSARKSPNSSRPLLEPGYELAPEVPEITAEAIGGALYALFYDHVKEKGPERLAELVPWAVYVTLTPFIGAEEAYAVATE